MRPCIEHKADLEPCHSGGYIAIWGTVLRVHGNTPAEAMLNFDLKWGELELPQPPAHSKWLFLGLSPTEARMLDFIMRAGKEGIHRERLLAMLYSGSEKDWPQDRILDIFAIRIRKKLKAVGSNIEIQAVKGFGWRAFEPGQDLALPPEFMALLRKRREARLAA